MITRDEGHLTGADLPVEPDGGVEREQALGDARPEPGGARAAVAFEAELAFLLAHRPSRVGQGRRRRLIGKHQLEAFLPSGQ